MLSIGTGAFLGRILRNLHSLHWEELAYNRKKPVDDVRRIFGSVYFHSCT
jgi:hypothetical protein